MGTAVQREGRHSAGDVRNGNREARRDRASVRQKITEDTGVGNSLGEEPDSEGEVRHYIPFAEIRAKWEQDPEFLRISAEHELPWNTHMALLDARWAADLTQTEIAARMGTTQSAVARLENGWHLPSLRTIERYAKALGMTVEVRLVPAIEKPAG